MKQERHSPLRLLRLSLPMPATLAEVSAWLRARGLRCTIQHLSCVERGLKPGGPKLRAALGFYYGKNPSDMDRVFTYTARSVRRKKSA